MNLLASSIAVALCWLVSSSAQAQTISADLTKEQQTMEGFGGFGPKKVWWSEAPYFDDAYVNAVVDDLGVTIVRTQLYWDFEPTNDNSDPATANDAGFNLAPTSDNGKQLEFLRALVKKKVKVIASVWTPPIWMKLNPDDGLAPFCQGQCGGTLNPDLYEEFAEYLFEYVKKFKAETGADLYALSLANEPLFETPNPFESVTFTPKTYAQALQVVGRRFRKEGVTTKLFGPEHMGSFDWNEGAFQELLDNPDVAPYLDAYAVHSYLDGVAADYGSADGWAKMFQRVHAAGKSFWMTETSGGSSEKWEHAWSMVRGLHLALKYGQINAWVYWYMAGDLFEEANPDTPTPIYYAFKQYYRYVRPGYVQVESTSTDTQVLVNVFKRGNGLTAVLINNGPTEKTATFDPGSLSALTAPAAGATVNVFRTSATEKSIAVGPLTAGSLLLPATSITTVYLEDTAAPPADGAAGGAATTSPGSGGSPASASGGSGGATAATKADAGGCSCRVGATGGSTGGAGLAAGLVTGLALMWTSKRRQGQKN